MKCSAVRPEIARVVDHADRPNRSHDNGPDTSHTSGNRGVLAGLTTLWAARQTLGPSVITDAVLAGQTFRDETSWGAPHADCESPDDPLGFEPRKGVGASLGPAFSADAFEAYLDLACPIFEEAVEAWIARGQVAFKPAARDLFARVSARVLAGIDDPAEAARLDRTMHLLRAARMARSPGKPWHPSSLRARRAQRALFNHFRVEVDRRRRSPGPDLFSRLCDERERKAWADDDALVRAFLGVIRAVFDTSAAPVTSMAYLLATHWKWQEYLQTESICATLGCARNSDLGKLVRHELVWNETLRLFPVFPTVARVALRDVTLGGEPIAAGTVVRVALGAAYRDPSCWACPDSFNPERFRAHRDHDLPGADPHKLVAIGIGANPGARLAALEAKVFWHTIGTRARFRLAPAYCAEHEFRPLGIVSGKVELNLEPLVAR